MRPGDAGDFCAVTPTTIMSPIEAASEMGV
jgi:hypothetical protein